MMEDPHPTTTTTGKPLCADWCDEKGGTTFYELEGETWPCPLIYGEEEDNI